MNISDEYNIKLKSEMKKVFTSYANDVTELTTVLDFYFVIQFKSPIMVKLPVYRTLKTLIFVIQYLMI